MDQVEEVKQKTDIVELVSGYVTLKQAGRNFKGLCPFHQEKTPSFMVNPELGIYKCFGCSKGGDVFNFVEEIEGLEFGEALAMLAERAGVKLQPRPGQADQTELDQMREVHDLANQYYHYLLTKHTVGKIGRDYLKSRKITAKIIDKFQLGFAINAWDGLARFLVTKKKFSPELLEKAGLLVRSSKGSHYDRFRGRIIFPLRDHKGKTVGFAGRILPIYTSDKEAKYINSPETPLYHKSQMLYGLYEAKQAIREKDRVVLVEGELDMISSFTAGMGETVAIKGTALTEDHIRLLGRYTHNLILALDADAAGTAAAKRSIILAENAGMNVKVIEICGGKDPDDIARGDPKLWRQMVEAAVDVYQFYLNAALKEHNPSTVEGKRRITAEIIPVLDKISNRVIRDHYVRKLAATLGVGEESVNAEIERSSRGEKLAQVTTKPTPSSAPDQASQLGREVVRLLWETDSRGWDVAKKRLAGLPLPGATGQLIQRWLELEANQGGDAAVVAFIKKLPPEIRALAGEIYLEPVDDRHLERDLETTLDQFEKYLVRQKMDQLTGLIKEAERNKNKGDLKNLQSQFVHWSRRLS